jgi:hypothetical protein
MGRRPINAEPMTAAQRKTRSRANALGELVGQLELAAREAAQWRECMASGRGAVTDRDIQAGFEAVSMHIAAALLAVPRS